MAKVRIGINGFGRIGRGFVRAMVAQRTKAAAEFDLALINDVTDAKTLSHLLRHDSIHGRFPGDVTVSAGALVVNGDAVAITAERDPAQIKWKDHKVDIVIEASGRFVDRESAGKHLTGGAKKVLITAPAKNPDKTLAVGINLDTYEPSKHHILSNASCTTNCLAPIAKVLHRELTIVTGLMTTIHSYTNDQRILDLPHEDLRRARAAALSMIPTSTGAARALKEVIPELEGKLDGMAIRVPTPNVSVVDLTCRVAKPTTAEEINNRMRKYAEGEMRGVLTVSDEPMVSIDFNGNTHSSILDASLTTCRDDLVKVLSWYDNEMGFSHRLLDLARFVAEKL
jgi:glyceraldehyde 3-phosphate dehydrogenase